MKIERGEVEYVARLARLKLSEEEEELFTDQLNAILEYIGKLNELDTSTVDPTFHVVSHHNTMREDDVRDSSPQDVSLGNAPDRAKGCFRVPKII